MMHFEGPVITVGATIALGPAAPGIPAKYEEFRKSASTAGRVLRQGVKGLPVCLPLNDRQETGQERPGTGLGERLRHGHGLFVFHDCGQSQVLQQT